MNEREIGAENRLVCGYARVSTAEQNAEMQVRALKQYGCDLVFQDDGVSGGVHPMQRPQFSAAIDALSDGGVLVVSRLDRLGRSLSAIISIVSQFEQCGIQLVSLTERIQTNTAMGKAFMHFIALLSELERDLIRERTIEGLRAAEARGQKLGRPFALSDVVLADAYEKYDAGALTIPEIAMCLSVSERTLKRGFERVDL